MTDTEKTPEQVESAAEPGRVKADTITNATDLGDETKAEPVKAPDFPAVIDADFEALVIESTGIVIAWFWAEWCLPCGDMIPMLEAYIAEHPDVKVFVANIETAPNAAAGNGLRGVPFISLFIDGSLVAQRTGLPKSAELLATWINGKTSPDG